MSPETEVEAAAEPMGPLDRAGYLLAGLDVYPTTLEAVDDLLSEVAPQAEQLDQPDRWFAAFGRALEQVPQSRRKEVAQTLRDSLTDNATAFSSMAKTIVDLYFDQPWGPGLYTAVRETLLRRPRLPVLLNSLLTNLVSTFEIHIAETAGAVYRAEPRSLDGSREPEFSLADLRDLGSIAEAVDLAVERRLDKLTRGSLAEWRKHFRDAVKIDLSDLAIDYDRVQEILHRRNAIVHHDALVSAQYLKASGRSDVSLGDDLSCSVEYVRAAVDELLALGFLLNFECLRKFTDDDELCANRLHEFESRLVGSGRWRVLWRIAEHGLTIPDDALGRSIFQVNVWLSRKHLHGIDSVSTEVQRWDVSASDSVFVVAKACLLGDLETAFALLPELISSEKISGKNLLEWPIFADVRTDPRFSAFRASVSDSVDSDEAFEYESRMASHYVGIPSSPVYHSIECRRAGAGAAPITPDEVESRRPARCCVGAGAA